MAALVAATAACGDGSDNPEVNENASALCPFKTKPVDGPPDTHCGAEAARVTHETSCHHDAHGHAETDGGIADPEEREPSYNGEGDDDECKYHVAWSIAPVCQGEDTSISVTITRKVDGAPAEGAEPGLDLLLTDTHLAPNTNPSAIEVSAGHYSIGPVRFDAPGRWTARFHLYEMCDDALEDSPHGHVAYYIDVP